MVARYPMKMAKSILKQVLQGLVQMHENGVGHGDLKMGNMVFSVKDVMGDIGQEGSLDDRCVAWPVEGESEGVPKCLYAAQPLTRFVDLDDFGVKLSDFGGGKSFFRFFFEMILMSISRLRQMNATKLESTYGNNANLNSILLR